MSRQGEVRSTPFTHRPQTPDSTCSYLQQETRWQSRKAPLPEFPCALLPAVPLPTLLETRRNFAKEDPKPGFSKRAALLELHEHPLHALKQRSPQSWRNTQHICLTKQLGDPFLCPPVSRLILSCGCTKMKQRAAHTATAAKEPTRQPGQVIFSVPHRCSVKFPNVSL